MVVYEIETYLYKEPARRQKASVCNPTFKGAAEDLFRYAAEAAARKAAKEAASC